MNRKIKDTVKTVVFSSLCAFLITYYGLSMFNPKKGIDEILAQERDGYGKPTHVVSKYDQLTTKYTRGFIYPADTDFKDKSAAIPFTPTRVVRGNYDNIEKIVKYTLRDAMEPVNMALVPNKKYTFQFNLPQRINDITVTYDGLQYDVKLFKAKEPGLIIGKVEFTSPDKKRRSVLKAEVIYANKEMDYFEITVIGGREDG